MTAGDASLGKLAKQEIGLLAIDLVPLRSNGLEAPTAKGGLVPGELAAAARTKIVVGHGTLDANGVSPPRGRR